MHELSIAGYLMESVESEAERIGAGRVCRIDLLVGDRLGVVDSSLLFCFELLSGGTVAEGAELAITHVPTRFRCREHGEYGRTGDDFECPRCRRVGELMPAGGELLVESLEVER